MLVLFLERSTRDLEADLGLAWRSSTHITTDNVAFDNAVTFSPVGELNVIGLLAKARRLKWENESELRLKIAQLRIW